jgi:GAF domain-containing protein
MDESELGGIHGEIARLARDMHSSMGSEVNVDDVLFEVTDASLRLLPGVDHAGVNLVEGRIKKVRSTAATDPVPKTLDALQERYAQGPCLDALWQHHTVRVDDFASEQRWPDFVAALLAETPVRSGLSIQLFTHEWELGSLNLYADQPHVFTPQLEELALALAAHAAIAFSGARRGHQFESALASRDIIGQAKGIIMERFQLNAVAAFRLLIKLSQDSNTAVAEVARQLVVGGCGL